MSRISLLAALGAVLMAVACEPPFLSDAARRQRLLDDRDAILEEDAARRIRAYLAWVGEEHDIDYHVVVAALDGASPERRAVELFAERETGSATGGRGLLLLVDPSREQVRVEVGYALEPQVTDLAASRMLSDYLAPYFRSGETSAGIEASIEALVETVRPRAADVGVPAEPAAAALDTSPHDRASGGGGASIDLLRDLPDDRLDDETRAALRAILMPQPDPRSARDLEIALLHKGLYFQEAALYDAAWRQAARPGGWSPSRLRAIARQWDRAYELHLEDPLAVAYYPDARELGPVFLRREAAGWIIDASDGARTIVYDYSNTGWYARDDGSPYLALLGRALDLERVTLRDGVAAWQMK